MVKAANSSVSGFPISIKNVSKQFKGRKVLDDISLDIKPGEIFGLVGLNGIGKTTLIKIMLDLLDPDSGSVSFFDKPATVNSSRKNISYLPEKFQPSPFLKGTEFLSISLSYFGKKCDMEKARKMAAGLDLQSEALDRIVNKYSKGMGQKLGLLSVFLTEAPLLILDEPMSGLDPLARILLKDMLRDYRKAGNTIFFSSHILADIEEICDRIAILHNKKIVFLGKPSEFIQQHKSDSLERAFLEVIKQAA